MERLKYFWSYLNGKNATFDAGYIPPQKDAFTRLDKILVFTPLHFVAYLGDAKVIDFMINNLDSDDPTWSEKCMNDKGQLISKCLFFVSSILPKNERKQFDLWYHSSKVELFVRFLGELKIPKRHFEIN